MDAGVYEPLSRETRGERAVLRQSNLARDAPCQDLAQLTEAGRFRS